VPAPSTANDANDMKRRLRWPVLELVPLELELELDPPGPEQQHTKSMTRIDIRLQPPPRMSPGVRALFVVSSLLWRLPFRGLFVLFRSPFRVSCLFICLALRTLPGQADSWCTYQLWLQPSPLSLRLSDPSRTAYDELAPAHLSPFDVSLHHHGFHAC